MGMADNLNPTQLKLFMTGTEWKNELTHSTDGPLDIVMPQMLEEASVSKESGKRYPQGAGTLDSLREHGWDQQRSINVPATTILEDPNGKATKVDKETGETVSLGRVTQSEGHHRIAAAAHLESLGEGPFFIPTNIVDNSAAGRKARNPEPRTPITPKSSVMPPKTEEITKHLR
jgi:hypothetical protein